MFTSCFEYRIYERSCSPRTLADPRREIYLLPLGFSASLTPSFRTPLIANPFPSCWREVLTWTVKLYFELLFERRALPLSVLQQESTKEKGEREEKEERERERLLENRKGGMPSDRALRSRFEFYGISFSGPRGKSIDREVRVARRRARGYLQETGYTYTGAQTPTGHRRGTHKG